MAGTERVPVWQGPFLLVLGCVTLAVALNESRWWLAAVGVAELAVGVVRLVAWFRGRPR